MAKAEIRKVLKLGRSLGITFPSSWAKGRIKAGEEMVIVADGELRIFPVHVKSQAEGEGEGADE